MLDRYCGGVALHEHLIPAHPLFMTDKNDKTPAVAKVSHTVRVTEPGDEVRSYHLALSDGHDSPAVTALFDKRTVPVYALPTCHWACWAFCVYASNKNHGDEPS